MYAYFNGIVKDIESTYIVIDVNGVGYQIFVANPYEYEIGNQYQVYIYNHIKEDEYSLYGFKNKDEKELFLNLISVKGIGPKMALPLLATGSISGIVDAIERENILYLKKFPKIGEKVARQIILDLKGKIHIGNISTTNNHEDLALVLQGLGYKDKEYKTIIGKVDTSMPLESQVKEALKLLLK